MILCDCYETGLHSRPGQRSHNDVKYAADRLPDDERRCQDVDGSGVNPEVL